VINAVQRLSASVCPSDVQTPPRELTSRRVNWRFYVARILNGAKSGDLPVAANGIKRQKRLGITVPQTLLVAADESIE
jgi:hypothetical protein